MVQEFQGGLPITGGWPTDGERALWATLHMNGVRISRRANNYWRLTHRWGNGALSHTAHEWCRNFKEA